MGGWGASQPMRPQPTDLHNPTKPLSGSKAHRCSLARCRPRRRTLPGSSWPRRGGWGRRPPARTAPPPPPPPRPRHGRTRATARPSTWACVAGFACCGVCVLRGLCVAGFVCCGVCVLRGLRYVGVGCWVGGWVSGAGVSGLGLVWRGQCVCGVVGTGCVVGCVCVCACACVSI